VERESNLRVYSLCPPRQRRGGRREVHRDAQREHVSEIEGEREREREGKIVTIDEGGMEGGNLRMGSFKRYLQRREHRQLCDRYTDRQRGYTQIDRGGIHR
jgi:hypothetical protein